MQQARCGLGLFLHGAKRDRERRLQRLGGGSGNCIGRRLGQRSAHQLDRLARDVSEAGSQARMFQRRCGRSECVEVFFRHQYHYRHLSSTFSIALVRNGPAAIKVMRSDHYLHPEFGVLSPTPRFRRELRTACFSLLLGIGIGAAALIALSGNKHADDAGVSHVHDAPTGDAFSERS
jgi:hypothetical protein